ncbi:hypothetical protein JCM6882_001012 [Rhodosporidiobolus microsporus]
MVSSNAAIFKPLKVGRMELSNRIAMAPLTRFRANERHEPQDVHAEYYSQRGSTPGTLLITEATFIDGRAGVYTGAPGLFTLEQVAGWKKVVDAVHARGSYLVLQLWALGRAADAGALRKEYDADVVSASDVPFEGGATPRPLTKAEIQDYIHYYARAAKLFIEEAGGDAVEIHGANGYLLDQFLQTNSNKRTDEYGGSVENRARFPLEVVRAVTEAVGEDRVGIRLSPYSKFQGMKMDTLEEIHETFSYVVDKIRTRHPNFAFIHAVESRIAGNTTIEADKAESLDFLRNIWAPKPFFVAGGFDGEHGPEVAEQYENNVVVYGRHFISNPDLVERLRQNIPLTKYDRDTFYLIGPHETRGYTDYPFATEQIKN